MSPYDDAILRTTGPQPRTAHVPAFHERFREPPDAATFDGRTILITGGTGSFGQKLCAFILSHYRPRRLIVFSRDELKQYDMQQRFGQACHPSLRFFIGDVRDAARLELAMRDVDFVVHAAALKQVPTAEYNPFECIRTNVHGAQNVVEAAMRTGVQRVIALSTDKAVNPINLYGASKLASDKIFVAANNVSGRGGTRFSVVRYGNVVGSRGSIVPLFRRLQAEGAGSVPITDARMTRFWITLEQGAVFVLCSLARMQGGEIFVPKIPSMRISDLAHALVPGVQQETIGIRPGEKLHEVLIGEDDARNTIGLPDHYVVEPAFAYWSRSPDLEQSGSIVESGFRYASDTNGEWLDRDGLLAMIGEAGE